MAFRNYQSLSNLVDELDEQLKTITRLKDELSHITSLEEYNELAQTINALVDDYNEKRELIKNAL